jgi:DNA-binding CsgD family transcriptional regulator
MGFPPFVANDSSRIAARGGNMDILVFQPSFGQVRRGVVRAAASGPGNPPPGPGTIIRPAERQRGAPDLVVSGTGDILVLSAQAAAVLAREDALRQRANRLEAMRPSAQSALMAALRDIAEGAAESLLLRLDRLKTESDYVLRLSAIVPSAVGEPRLVRVAISDPDTDLAALSAFAAHVFQLTEAEARLCQKLLEGLSTTEIAQALAVKPATIRTYLTAIFAKNGCRSQVELVRRLMLLGGVL